MNSWKEEEANYYNQFLNGFNLLIARREDADEEIQPFWDDQIQIVQKIIKNLDAN
jgi:hypothetical protein